MLCTIDVYSSLGLSHIEGIETMHSRFQLIVSGMKKKPYDILDQRKTDFDVDFEEFKRSALDIRVSDTIIIIGASLLNTISFERLAFHYEVQ